MSTHTRAAGDLLLDRYLALMWRGEEEGTGEGYGEGAGEGYEGPEGVGEGQHRAGGGEGDKGEGAGPERAEWEGAQRRRSRERERAEEQQVLWKQLEAAARQTFLVLPGWAAAIQQQFDLQRQQEEEQRQQLLQQQRAWEEGRRGRGAERRSHAEVDEAELLRWEQEHQRLYGRRRKGRAGSGTGHGRRRAHGDGGPVRWGSGDGRMGLYGQGQGEGERVRLGSSSGSVGSSRTDSEGSSSGSDRGSRGGAGSAAGLPGVGAAGYGQQPGRGEAAGAGAVAGAPAGVVPQSNARVPCRNQPNEGANELYGCGSDGLRRHQQHQQQHPHQAGATHIHQGPPGARADQGWGAGPPGGGFQAGGDLGEGYHGVGGGGEDALVEAVAALFSGPRPLLPSAPRVPQPPRHPRQHSDSEEDGTWGPAAGGSVNGGVVPLVPLLPPRRLLPRLLDVDVSEVVELVGLAQVSRHWQARLTVVAVAAVAVASKPGW